MHSARRGERKGARRESAHLSNGGNYSTTPSPVTRGSGGWGCFKGRLGGIGRHGVGGCRYPESNWPETSCAVPADFHNERISPLTLSLCHTHRRTHTHTHFPLSASSWWWLLSFVLSSFFLFIQQITTRSFAQLKFYFFSFCSSLSPKPQVTRSRMEIKGQLHCGYYKLNRLQSCGCVRYSGGWAIAGARLPAHKSAHPRPSWMKVPGNMLYLSIIYFQGANII